ncbi:MAG: YicC/YloC family endoribonuclease [Chthoniobacterales bacterium]
MISMTGHGRGEANIGELRVTAECSSVNRKQLDVAFQIPREWNSLESAIRDEVAAVATRGRIQVFLEAHRKFTADKEALDHEMAAGYHAELEALRKKLKITSPVTLDHILRCPNLFLTSQSNRNFNPENEWPCIQKALREALQGMLAMRKKEGKHLQQDLLKRSDTLSAILHKIRKLAPSVTTHHRRNLKKRLENANLNLDSIEPRLIEEIALFAERCDITEELTRLESHIDQLTSKLDAKGPVGRSIEFLLQEMTREFNTLGSKSNNSSIAHLAVEGKTELDKVREQILNLE